jgi:hypothetical protein
MSAGSRRGANEPVQVNGGGLAKPLGFDTGLSLAFQALLNRRFRPSRIAGLDLHD